MEQQIDVAVKPEPKLESMHLVARNPVEMAAAQANLATWFQNKVSLCATEVSELAGAVAEAKDRKWKSSTLASQLSRAKQRSQFYEKCLLAVNLGYTIIPDIPIGVFAIRTMRETPNDQYQVTEDSREWARPIVEDERPAMLPAGDGEYKSPKQIVRTSHLTRVENGETLHIRSIRAVQFDTIEFPIIAAVPAVMSATQQAMTARLFDQIGVSPQGKVRQADPLIIGQIFGELRGHRTRRTASFLIAWHLDLRSL